MSLHKYTEQEHGVERIVLASVGDIERINTISAINQDAAIEAEYLTEQMTRADEYLDSLSAMVKRDTSNMFGGTERFQVAAPLMYGMSSHYFPELDCLELSQSGTEKAEFIKSAGLLVKKAWVKLKKMLYKAIAKMMGYLAFRTTNIEKDLATVKHADEITFRAAKELSPERLKQIHDKLPGLGGVDLSQAIFPFIDDLLEAKSKDEILKLFHDKKKTKMESMIDAFKALFGGKPGDAVGIQSKALANLINKELDANGTTYFMLPLTKKIKYIKLDGARVTYNTMEYPVIDTGNLGKYIPILGKQEAISTMEQLKSDNDKFQERVKKYFELVDKAGNAADKALTKLKQGSDNDIDKDMFTSIKSIYALTPRIAFDQIVSLNDSINGAWWYVKVCVDQHNDVNNKNIEQNKK